MGVLRPVTVARLRTLTVRLAFHDQCEIVGSASPGKDDYGNDLPATPVVTAGRPCSLRKVGQQGNERVIADRLGWTSAYAIDLDYGAPVTRDDTIRVNGWRTFHVGDIDEEGNVGIQTTAIVEERG